MSDALQFKATILSLFVIEDSFSRNYLITTIKLCYYITSIVIFRMKLNPFQVDLNVLQRLILTY